MTTCSILTRTDYEDYLIRLYFGSNTDLLSACLGRAYLDFNRTLHGLKNLSNADKLHSKATNHLQAAITELQVRLPNPIDPTTFDNWHKDTCRGLIAVYSGYGYHLYVGQAQKWVNMTFKYIYTLGEERVSGFEPAYRYCHIPLDNIILDVLAEYSFPSLNCSWSRLDDYDEYFMRQAWIRRTFVLAPLDVEFMLWLGKPVEIKEMG